MAQILGHYKKSYSSGDTATEFFLNDNLGSRKCVLNSSGNLVNKFKYSAWGESELKFGTNSNSYLASFTGKQYDATGLIYFNARYYDPASARFISEDPSRKSTDWYSYCDNNPIVNVDLDGKRPIVDSLKDYFNGQSLGACFVRDIPWLHNIIVDSTPQQVIGTAIRNNPITDTAYDVAELVSGQDYVSGFKFNGMDYIGAIAGVIALGVPSSVIRKALGSTSDIVAKAKASGITSLNMGTPFNSTDIRKIGFNEKRPGFWMSENIVMAEDMATVRSSSRSSVVSRNSTREMGDIFNIYGGQKINPGVIQVEMPTALFEGLKKNKDIILGATNVSSSGMWQEWIMKTERSVKSVNQFIVK
jgi:RHS repeat-associated protein